MDAQSQLGGFAHPGMALVLFALLTASNDTQGGTHVAPRSIYASETHRSDPPTVVPPEPETRQKTSRREKE